MAQEFPTNTEYASRLEPAGWSGLKHLVEAQDQARLVLFLEGQSRVLELMGRSAPLAAVLDELMRVLEQQVEGMACCVLLVSEDRRHLRHGSAPSLPERYRHAIDGGAIGPRAGSCGTAAFLRSPVIVTDIARDPLWTDHRDLALEVGLRACWSTPILSGHGDVLGTFAMYHRQPFAPSSMHLSLIDLATNLARIAIERDLAERERERLWDAKRFADPYLMVLRATSAAVWEWDLCGSSGGYWNDGLAALGYEAQGTERTLDWWTRHIHPDDVERVRRDIERALDSGETHWEEECRFRRKDGTYAEVVAHGLIVRDEAGKPLRIVGALQDITQRKRHEQEMAQMAERFRSATVAGAIGTWRLDVRTELLHADPSLNRLLGQGEEETVLRLGEAMRGVHPEDRTRVVEALQQSIAAGLPFESDHRVVLADREIRWLRSRGRVLFDTQGRPGVVTGAVADITELKHAEQSMAILADASRLLAESLDFEQILSIVTRMVVPSFADGVLIILKDSQDEPRLAVAHSANPEALEALRELQESGNFRIGAPSRRVLQTGRGEVQSRWNADWVRASDVNEKLLAIARRFHVTSTIHVPIAMGSLPIGVIVFGATETRVYNARDLAFAEELARRASNAMRNAQLFQTASAERERAEEAAALRERLIAIVGHDLRNPLSAISMAAQILSRSVTGGPNEKLVSRIQSSANRMTRMIAQILDFARIRVGMSFEIEPKSADLHQICNTVIEELRLSWPDRQIELRVSGVGDAVCDADRIAQVLSNLIGNALQHGTRGPISVTASDAAPDAVAVEVHNFGPPIPERAQATMFDAFRREATTRDHASKSIGLGLFIANEIVRAHGGSIAVRSPDRDGTTFRVVLPRTTARSSPDANRK